MFRWAWERAGFEPGALAERFPRLEAWERGEAQPTLKQLESFAQATHTPVGFLSPGAAGRRGPDPRLPDDGQRSLRRPSADLLDTVYICQQRQEWYRDFARTEGEAPLPFVGSVRLASDIEETAARIRAALGFDLEERRRTPTWTEALRRFIGQADDSASW